jgi:N,N'-diacetyllegionaminate synthase|tara:strand:+ start:3989 stop:4993 length:1005 start_codon:yes stop_codon:yes gene_type:complete
MKRVIVIAEVGPNHNGKIRLARKLIDIAKDCGADFIKFQTSIPELHISKFAKKANYQSKNTSREETQLQMAKKNSLTFEQFRQLNKYCKKKKINFLSTAFDLKSISFLNKLNMKFIKIPSGEITNYPYLSKIGKLKKKIILSTGMANMKEIGEALEVLTKKGVAKKKITVMQCNTEYPTPLKDANLRAMISIKKKYGVSIGYSDHTEGIEAALAATAMGAEIIEKHITLDKNLSGPDHKASITKKELKMMIDAIRKVELTLGDGIKKASSSEKKNIKIARNSIVAARDIKKGEKFNNENLIMKRPGNGISPMKLFTVLGKIAKKNFIKDEQIKL